MGELPSPFQEKMLESDSHLGTLSGSLNYKSLKSHHLWEALSTVIFQLMDG